MLATLIQKYEKKIISFLIQSKNEILIQSKNERPTEILQAVRCHILWLY